MNNGKYSESDVIEFLKKIKVDSIGISKRVVDLLEENGMETLYDLCETELLKFKSGIPGLGEVGQKEVIDRMEQFGLKFKWNENSPYSDLFLDKYKQNCNTRYEEVDISLIIDVLMCIEREKYYSD